MEKGNTVREVRKNLFPSPEGKGGLTPSNHHSRLETSKPRKKKLQHGTVAQSRREGNSQKKEKRLGDNNSVPLCEKKKKGDQPIESRKSGNMRMSVRGKKKSIKGGGSREAKKKERGGLRQQQRKGEKGKRGISLGAKGTPGGFTGRGNTKINRRRGAWGKRNNHKTREISGRQYKGGPEIN